MTKTLLPCPFCGRQPNVMTRAQGHADKDDRPWVSFISCMCGGYSARAHQYGTGMTPELSVEVASGKWNTRHAGPPMSAHQ